MRYATLRSIHGLLALSLAGFLGLYTVSGWMMTHNSDNGTPVESTLTAAAPPLGGAAEDEARVRAVALAVAEGAGLEGAHIKRVRFADGEWRVSLRRVARSAEITLTPAAATARVSLREEGFEGGVKLLHRITAKHVQGARLVWVVLVDVLSIAMIAFSVTGLLMFLSLRKDRRIGWLLLGATAFYTVGGIAWLSASR
jgi:hypothetical protein